MYRIFKSRGQYFIQRWDYDVKDCFHSALLECGILSRKIILFFSDLTADISLKDIQWIFENNPSLLKEWTIFRTFSCFDLKNGSYINFSKNKYSVLWCDCVFINNLTELKNENLHHILSLLREDDEQFKALIPTYLLEDFYEYFERVVDRAVGRFFE